ncbi:acylpyruvase FAHD1, mitochondrial [Topomyia yanbarensis]|uniref:acylpyruvase FAHD1, mitochondrial n=1 Tax=Topomyia yanbarensis TaxID=2498891 RepID=UPI00273B25FB|nr:acylpyruvase FAHD1, mitochondrial [Topomyia yanbarensis]
MSQKFIKSTRKIIGAGVNYKEILRQTNAAKPANPVIFFKPISTLISSNEGVIKIPKVFGSINYEAELGVIIGKSCKNISTDQAMSYVAGYCLALDMTGMDFIVDARSKGLPWCLGKGFDTSTPVSRFISPEELGDPTDVRVWCKVNEQMKQDDTTRNLIFTIAELIAFTSKYMSLEKNDLILTGTPAGAGPVKNGDILECGLGDIVQMTFQVEDE